MCVNKQSRSDCLLPWLVDRLLLSRTITSAKPSADLLNALTNTLHLVNKTIQLLLPSVIFHFTDNI